MAENNKKKSKKQQANINAQSMDEIKAETDADIKIDEQAEIIVDADEEIAENDDTDAEQNGDQQTVNADDAEAKEKFDEFMKKVAQMAAEKEAAEAQLIRLQADFDNYRRRKTREDEELIKNANAFLMTGLLPVLDNFERAIKAITDGSPEKEGVVMIQKQLLEVLAKSGLAAIEAMDADFDPKVHEAVMQTEAGADKKGKVTMEIQKGYMLNEKLLRPTMVQVGC